MRAGRTLGASACAALLAYAALAAAEEIGAAGWREDFRTEPQGWEIRTKPGTKVTSFRVEPATDAHDGALLVTADNASGMYGTHLRHVDLRRTPILRWRWRVLTLPAGADGREPKLDDQAIAIHVGHGGLFRQKTIAYRWETKTPIGSEGEALYAGGIVKTKWIAIRNQEDQRGTFYVEERNVARDYQRAFGFVPDDITVGVVSNSQYTGTSAVAELDWIEIVAAPVDDAPAPPDSGRAEARP